MTGVSFVWLVAYDWRRACEQVARLWSFGEEHIIAWDRAGRTWGGGVFAPPSPEKFWEEMRRHRVLPSCAADRAAGLGLRFFLGNFYAPGVGVAELETHERNALSWLARPGNLIVTLDADEEAVNFAHFQDWWRGKLPAAYVYIGQSAPVYKVIGDTALVFSTRQRMPVAMGWPGIFDGPRACRSTVECPLRVVNWFLSGRTDAELRLKLAAMSYMREQDSADRLLEQWHATTLENFAGVQGFAGNYGRAGLVPVSVADLRAGRWSGIGGVP